jgi:flagellar basal-body rod protein FlgB
MNLFDTTQIGLAQALQGSSMRQSAIAQNIANVNTPGYKRQDVDFQTALAKAWDDGTPGVESVAPTMEDDPNATMRADGSSVDIDVEASEQAKNGLQYEAVESVLKSRIGILKSAIGVA